MKLLLKKRVEKLGRIGDVVNVANGYARNFLLPKGLGVNVTPGAIKQMESAKRKEDVRRREENTVLTALADELRDFSCTIPARANEDGKLFGSVSAHMIADELKNQGFNVEENMVVLEEPIKQCDVYNLTIAISSEIKTNIKLWVVNENEAVKTENKAEVKEEI